MTRLALRGLGARKLRTALTALAVLLGVAMVSGTYIETDQIRNAFEGITRQSNEGIDAVVTPTEAFSGQFSSELPTLDGRIVERIERVPGVDAAEGQLSALGKLVVDGEPIDTLGAPGLVIADAGERFDPTEIVAGRAPGARAEAVLLDENAEDNGIELGDRVGVTTRTGLRTVEVVGLASFGDSGSALGGTTVVVLPLTDVERWFGLEGRLSSVSVIAGAGVTPGELAARLDAALAGAATVQTAEQNAEETAAEINDQIGSFLTPALLALAGAAVLVGAFIIFNTFSITVSQRLREFALMRALGTTRGQILAIVGVEALAIGVAASALGLAAGVGFARLLNALFDVVGFGIPTSAVVLEARTVVVAASVGIGTTLASALIPALRATRVPPVRAMSGALPDPSARTRRLVGAAAVVLVLGGVALIAQGLYGSGSATAKLGAIAGGAIVLFVGIALSARYLVRPLGSLIGYPIERLLGTPGRLARENVVRNPSRTAVTSAALMVGLGLVVFVAVFAAGLRSSFSSQLDTLVKADAVVFSSGFEVFPSRAARIAGSVRGVSAAVPQRFEQLEINGEKSNIATDLQIAIDPTRIDDVYSFDWLEGDDSLLARLGAGETLVEEQFAAAHGLSVGDSYDALSPSGGEATLRVAGIYRDPTILQGSLSTIATLRSISPARDPISLLLAFDGGADAAAVERRVERALERFPALEVQSKAEYKRTVSAQLDQIVYLLYALLAMSIVISLFGIANSLFLAIYERTGEIGVLRAIGATGAQVRRIIRYESVITSVIGGGLGTAVGVALAAIVIGSLSEFGLGLTIPVAQLAAFMALAVLVGVVGAIAPARRAARVDPLEAIRHE